MAQLVKLSFAISLISHRFVIRTWSFCLQVESYPIFANSNFGPSLPLMRSGVFRQLIDLTGQPVSKCRKPGVIEGPRWFSQVDAPVKRYLNS
jgi:hypothetical protein